MADTPKNENDKIEAENARKFRVLHAAVSGITKDRKGTVVERDYYTGAIVNAAQLDNNEAHYLSQGAIEEIEQG
jgi:hypothetical protein